MLTLQIAAVILSIIGIVGSVVPAIPGPPIAWLAMLCAYFCHGTNGKGEEMTVQCLMLWLAVTIAITILDYIIPSYMTKSTGGHREASRGAMIGMLLGIFLTPVGMIIGSLVGAFIGEYIFAKSDAMTSVKATFGTFMGFITGTVMKLAVSAAMLRYVIVYLN